MAENGKGNNGSGMKYNTGKSYIYEENSIDFPPQDVQHVIVSDYVVSISMYAFDGHEKLKTVELPKNGILKSIGGYAFNDCADLTEINIPKSVENLDECAFRNCSALKKVVLPDGLKRIGPRAFEGCIELNTINIPDSIVHIGENAFYDCVSIGKVKLPEGVPFYHGTKDAITYDEPFLYTNEEFAPVDVRSLVIHSNVERIRDALFQDNFKELQAVEIQEGVHSIGRRAFANCLKLTSITIPKSVNYIGSNAFQGCDSLSPVTNFDNTPSVKDGKSFYAPLCDSKPCTYTFSHDDTDNFLCGPCLLIPTKTSQEQQQQQRRKQEQRTLVSFDCLYKSGGWGNEVAAISIIGHDKRMLAENRQYSNGRLVATSPKARDSFSSLSLVFDPIPNEIYHMWYRVGDDEDHMLHVQHAVLSTIQDQDLTSTTQSPGNFVCGNVESFFKGLLKRGHLDVTEILMGTLEHEDDPKDDFILHVLDKMNDVNKICRNGTTVLHFVAKKGLKKYLDKLLEDKKGADINKADEGGLTPLHYAARSGHKECIDSLLKKGAKLNIPSHIDGSTPIHLATRYGHEESLTLLLENKSVKIDQTDFHGLTPLAVAADYYELNSWKILINNGASIKKVPTKQLLDTFPYSDNVELLLPIVGCDGLSMDVRIEILNNAYLENPEDLLKMLDAIYKSLKAKPSDELKEVTRNILEKVSADVNSPEPFLVLLGYDEKIIPFEVKWFILENHALTKSEDVNKLYQPVLKDLSRESVRRRTVLFLMLDGYVYLAWIYAFMYVTVKHAGDSMGEPQFVGVVAMLVLPFYFIYFEWLDLSSREGRYFSDPWNWIDLLAIGFVIITAVLFLAERSIHEEQLIRNIVIAAGAFLCLSFVGYLRTTFLQFSIFVGGLSKILWDLIPFAVVTGIILVAFSYMYYIQSVGSMEGDEDNKGIDSFLAAFRFVFGALVGGPDAPTSFLDYLFSIIMVVILLNVVIAIVSDSWAKANEDTMLFFCKSRLELLRGIRNIFETDNSFLGKLLKQSDHNNLSSEVEHPDEYERNPSSRESYRSSFAEVEDDNRDDSEENDDDSVFTYVSFENYVDYAGFIVDAFKNKEYGELVKFLLSIPAINIPLGFLTLGQLWRRDVRLFLFGMTDPKQDLKSRNNENDADNNYAKKRESTKKTAEVAEDSNNDKQTKKKRFDEKKSHHLAAPVEATIAPGQQNNTNISAALTTDYGKNIDSRITDIENKLVNMEKSIKNSHSMLEKKLTRIEDLFLKYLNE